MSVKKILSLILACVMVLTVAACGDSEPSTPTTSPTTAPTTPPTTQPTTAPTTEPTTAPTEPDAGEMYWLAIEQLSTGSNYQMDVAVTKTVSAYGETYTESASQQITYTGYGTDDFRATVTEISDYTVYSATFQETYYDGVLYAIANDASYFRGAMDAETYTSRFAPVIMLDIGHYGSITLDAATNTVHFSDATAGEPWLVPEYAELVEASGTAVIGDDGALSASTYTVTYAIGGNEITYSYDMTVTPANDSSVADVADPEAYTELEYVDAPRMYAAFAGYLLQSYDKHSVSSTSVESVLSQAGGVMRNQVTTLNFMGTGYNYTAEVGLSLYVMSAQGSEEYEQEERFENNSYSVSENGSEHQTMSGVSRAAFQNYCLTTLVANIPDLTYFETASAEALGSVIYLEVTLDDAMGEALEKYISSMFWGDENFLDSYATYYETTNLTYYFGMDLYTGLPTAMGCMYEGYHTIEGVDFPLSVQLDQSFNLCDENVYKTLTDEVKTPEQPDEQATPLFYHVTGPDGQEMWLLGTIHVGDARTSYLPQEIYDAFDAADALAVEFNSEAYNDALEEDEELSAQVSDCYYFNDGSTTADHITDAELYEYAEKFLKASGNYNMNSPYMVPYLWSNFIDNYTTTQMRGISSIHGVDNQLIWRAEDQDKPIYDVESGLFQIQMLTGFSDGLQELLLAESLAYDPIASYNATRDLFEMWCAGDEAALIAYLTEEDDLSDLTPEELALVEEYNNAMGSDRNDDMHDVAVGYLESGEVVFYAVGLAHLLAEDGLVNTLRAAGYTVELVTFE